MLWNEEGSLRVQDLNMAQGMHSAVKPFLAIASAVQYSYCLFEKKIRTKLLALCFTDALKN